MTAIPIHESPALVAVRDLYAAGRQDADGNLTVPWDALLGWSQQIDPSHQGIGSTEKKPPYHGSMSGRMYADSDKISHFKASKGDAAYYGLSDDHRYVEVRYLAIPDADTDANGRPLVDEIVTPGLHLEMMDEDSCWMDVKGVHVWMRAVRVKGQRKLRLEVTCFADEAKPVKVEQGAAE